MGRIDDRLAELGLELPAAVRAAAGGRVPVRPRPRQRRPRLRLRPPARSTAPRSLVTGRVGAELDLERGYEAARLTALSILASLQARARRPRPGDAAGSRRSAWSSARPGFDKPPAVINGFTDLVLELWGDQAGRHARSAIGAGQLPFDVPVEVEAIVEIA